MKLLLLVDIDRTARGLHDAVAPNLLNMMLEQAKHEVFTEEEIVDEAVMFYLVTSPQH